MMTFYEYLAQRPTMMLPDSITMLAKLGIDPHGPHEIEVMRLTKQMKKVAERAPRKSRAGIVSPSGIRELPRFGSNKG